MSNKKKIAAKELYDQIQVIKDWQISTYEVNINWIKQYLQPKLDKLYNSHKTTKP